MIDVISATFGFVLADNALRGRDHNAVLDSIGVLHLSSALGDAIRALNPAERIQLLMRLGRFRGLSA